MAFRWWAVDDPLLVLYGSSVIPKNVVRVGPHSDKTFWIRAWTTLILSYMNRATLWALTRLSELVPYCLQYLSQYIRRECRGNKSWISWKKSYSVASNYCTGCVFSSSLVFAHSVPWIPAYTTFPSIILLSLEKKADEMDSKMLNVPITISANIIN